MKEAALDEQQQPLEPELVELANRGWPHEQIAEAYEISVGTVRKIVARAAK